MATLPPSLQEILSEGDPVALFDLVEELAVGSYGTVYRVRMQACD
jgi:hypothetical protein